MLFITGTDTGVGKTWITCTLLGLLHSRQIKAGVYKPACSGAEFRPDGTPMWADLEALRQHCSLNPALDLVCPQRFLAPVAPNVAARLQNQMVDDTLLSTGAQAWNGLCDVLVIEGAGGLFCPLSDRSTVLDLAKQLQATMVVVAANRLGVISHTRMTVELLQRAGLTVAGIVLNEIAAPDDAAADVSIPRNAEQLQHWIPTIPLLHCAWQSRDLTIVPRADVPEPHTTDQWLSASLTTNNQQLTTNN
jgi:dethiobiotin synthetase